MLPFKPTRIRGSSRRRPNRLRRHCSGIVRVCFGQRDRQYGGNAKSDDDKGDHSHFHGHPLPSRLRLFLRVVVVQRRLKVQRNEGHSPVPTRVVQVLSLQAKKGPHGTPCELEAGEDGRNVDGQAGEPREAVTKKVRNNGESPDEAADEVVGNDGDVHPLVAVHASLSEFHGALHQCCCCHCG